MEVLGIIFLVIIALVFLGGFGAILRVFTWIGEIVLKVFSRGCGYLLFVILFIMVILALL